MTCLFIASLLIAQRGTPASENPGATDARPMGAMRQVTPAYLRMNDPGFVARILQRADTPEGRRIANLVVPPEIFAQRERLLDSNRAYLRGVALVRPHEGGVRALPPKPTGRPKKDDGDKPVIGKPVKMPPGGVKEPHDVSQNLGTFMQSDSQSATGECYRRARHSGTLKIKEATGTAIEVARVDIQTGEVVDGKPTLTSDSGSGTQFHIEEGQEYVVRLRLDLSKAGSHKEDIVLDEGGTPFTFHVEDEIVEANGGFGSWVTNGGFYVVPGTSHKGVLHVKIKGNAPTTIRVSGSGPSGIKIQPTSKSVKVQDEVDIPFTFTAPAGAANADGPLDVEVSAYDGKASMTAHSSVRVETVWSQAKDYTDSAGNVHTVGTFTFSSAGDWEYTMRFSDSSIFSGDLAIAGFMLDPLLPNGRRLGTSLWSDWIGGAISPSTQTLSSAGHDDRLVGTLFIHCPAHQFLTEEGALGGGIVDNWQYWMSSNSIDELHVNP